MKPLQLCAISAISLILLNACQQKTESSVSDNTPTNTAATQQTAASTPTQTTVQLHSKDGKLSLSTSGQYTDKLAQANELISEIPTEQLVLLQRDDAADVLIYAADLGPAKADAKTEPAAYLQKLSSAIQADAALSNVKVAPQGQQLAYQFTEKNGDTDTNQACQAVSQEHIYVVCAISSSQSGDNLAQLVKQVTVK